MLMFSLLERLDSITEQEWDGVFRSGMIEGYAYHRALDESNLFPFQTRYAVIRDDDAVVAIAPFFIADFSFDTTIQGFLKSVTSAIRRIFPRFLRLKILFFGSPLTEECEIGFSDRMDKKTLLDFLNSSIKDFCKKEKIRVVVFNNLAERDRDIIGILGGKGYGSMESFPIARLRIDAKTLDEYIQTLGKNTRKDIKRKMKKAYESGELRIEERTDLNGIASRAYELYMNLFDASEVSFEKMTPEYLEKIFEHVPEIVRVFTAWVGDKMVAFNLCFAKGDICIDKYIGLDYEATREYNLYFATWCYNVEWCIRNGYRYYQSGTGDYEPKLRLGSDLIPLYVCCRHLNPFINLFVKPVMKLLKPANFDKDLKKIGKSEK